MELDQSVLTGGEVAAFKLRSLYRQYGYMPYKMSKFEEYELYALNKDFRERQHYRLTMQTASPWP